MALASASPMLSDGAWAETEVIERAARQAAPSQTFANAMAGAKAGTNNMGKSGKQLVDEIEQARQRMLANKTLEESAKEFLVGNNSRVKAAIPQADARAAEARKAPGRTPGRATEIRKPAVQEAAPKARPMSAAERYPLVDPVTEAPQAKQDRNTELLELQAEIADMRLLLEQQLDRLGAAPVATGNSPVLNSVGRRLERLGLPADLVSKVLSRCTKNSSLAEAWPDALANLAHQLPVSGRDIVDQGGVFAFVGPTGVGKTTTIGKLAARYVLQHGADKVALITTDTYRIAAHDQLRSIARILRVPVRVVDETNSLESLLRSLRHCSLVLIDTAGFRHGDPHLKAQLKALADQQQVKSYLVLSCNSQQQMLKASIHAYGAARLQGCVLTKLDETASMGEALGVVTQNRLPVAYTTDGQDIPKHIEVARGHQLVAKAVALLKQNAATAVS
jgi:flagellar biosynthesis protein FlhF